MYLVYGIYPVTDLQLVRLAERYAAARKTLLDFPHLAQKYSFLEAEPASLDDYLSVHTSEYVQILKDIYNTRESQLGIPVEGVVFEMAGVGGTLMATRVALKERCTTYHIGGGYHHGMPDRPNSIDYCNDVAIALTKILLTGVERILYIDLDVHHPDGVQKIFAGEPRILQVSLHQWPTDSNDGFCSFVGKGEAIGKKINMPFPPYTGDRTYLRILKVILYSVIRSYRPDVVFYQAGVDPYVKDPVGRLNLSLNGLYERDKIVTSMCRRDRIPFITVLGGGYNTTGTTKAIVNTLAALAEKTIVFDEPESFGGSSVKQVLRWYQLLRSNLDSYLELESVSREELEEV